MKENKYRITELNHLIKICRKLNDGSIGSTSRTYEGTRLFKKITLHAISFSRLWPESEDEFTIQNLDAGTLASITRNIIEAHNVYQYVCEPGISKEGFDFRIKLMGLHQCCNTLDILGKLGFANSDSTFSIFNMVSNVCKSELEKNPIFMLLPSKRRAFLIGGTKAYPDDMITNCKSPIEKTIESGLYNLFSNSTHSYPLGIENNSSWFTDNHISRINMLFLSIETVILYLSSVLKSYLSMRKKLTLLNKEDKDFINQFNDRNILDWLEDRRLKGQRKLVY